MRLKHEPDTELTGGTVLFDRWKKQKVDGVECPLCQLVNPTGSDSCSRCYYEFDVAAHRQTVSEVSNDEQGDLFDELMDEDDQSDDDSPLVDWTGHSFSMDDMTVDVSQYSEEGAVVVDQNVSMESQFDSPQMATTVAESAKQSEKQSEPEYELTSDDAPKDVAKFDYGAGPDLSYAPNIPTSPVVKLVEVTASEESDPVHATAALDEDANGAEQAKSEPETEVTPEPEDTAPEPEPAVIQPTPATPPQPVAIPPLPTAVPTAVPAAQSNGATAATPVTPSIPLPPGITSTSATPVVPNIPAVPTVPATPTSSTTDVDLDEDAVTPPAPVATSSRMIWPWAQGEPWDDVTVRKTLREVMEQAKSGDIENANRGLEALGPHLGDRIDLIFHVGVLLKKFQRDEEMQRMIENAQRTHPSDSNVVTAAQHLLV